MLSDNIKSMWDMPLAAVLTQGNVNSQYVVALSKSRQQTMTSQLASKLKTLVRIEGKKWFEVIKRIIDNDFSKGFQLCIRQQQLILPLIASLFRDSYKQQFEFFHKKVCQQIFYLIDTISQSNALHRTAILQQYLYNILKQEKDSRLFQISEIFCSLRDRIKIVQFLLQPLYKNYQNNLDANIDFLWERHETSVKLSLVLVELVEKMEWQAVRKLKVLAFQQVAVQFTDLFKQILPSLMQLISVIIVITNRQSTEIRQMPQPLKYIHPFIAKLIQMQRPEKLTQYYTYLTKIFIAFSRLSCMELVFIRNQSILNNLVDVTLLTNFIFLNNYKDINKQLLALNEEISSQVFSDTLAGYWMKMIVSFASNIGAFFNKFQQSIIQLCRSSSLAYSKGQQFFGLLLKISLLNNENILRQRRQIMENLLSEVVRILTSNWNIYNEWEKIQVLRFFLSFISKMQSPKSLMNLNSYEDIMLKCITLCLECLANSNSMIEGQIDELNPLQQQCYNILQMLPEFPNTLRLLSSNIQNIVNQFICYQNSNIKFIELFHSYITKIPDIVTRSSSLLLQYFNNIWINQVNQMQRRSFGTTKIIYNMKIVKIVHVCTTIIELNCQIDYDQIGQLIVNPILLKLCDPYSISYQDDLLLLLQTLLVKHDYFTPQVCRILSKLPLIYEKNNKKLSIIRKIYCAIAKSVFISKQILFEYPDLIKIMMNMFLDYSKNELSVQQYFYYKQQIKELLWSVQLFIQKFLKFLQQDEQMKQLINFHLYSAINACIVNTNIHMQNYRSTSIINIQESKIKGYLDFREILYQILFTIYHITSSPLFNHEVVKPVIALIKSTSYQQYLYCETIKMIPIVLIDQLLFHQDNHEAVLNDVISFCECMNKMQIQTGLSKRWESIPLADQWDQWPKNPKEYIENLLRDLRNRKKIDQMQHVQYLKAIQNVLR